MFYKATFRFNDAPGYISPLTLNTSKTYTLTYYILHYHISFYPPYRFTFMVYMMTTMMNVKTGSKNFLH